MNNIPDLASHTGICFLCSWQTEQPTAKIAQCLAAWHVYEEHPGTWQQIIGSSRQPDCPDPRDPAVRAGLLAGLS